MAKGLTNDSLSLIRYKLTSPVCNSFTFTSRRIYCLGEFFASFNPLTPNDPYSGRTAPLTPKDAFYIFIQQI